MPLDVIATAHPNIALVKYWGKRDAALNLPAVGSLSITLDLLETTTRLRIDDDLDQDRFVLNGAALAGRELEKVQGLARRMWRGTEQRPRLDVESSNNFPTAAGLASSASGFAALVYGLNVILQSDLSDAEISVFARQGSGSAPRSLIGGFALMAKGERDDGQDAIARPLMSASEWPLEVVVAITSTEKKSTSSTQGMELTRSTSPWYGSWVDGQEDDLAEAAAAIKTRDFERLADVSEFSCLKMHGLMMAARPGLMYWNATTLACLHAIRDLRAQGTGVFFTVDAGPQVKAICAPGNGAVVAEKLREIDGVQQVLETGLGDGAKAVVQGL